MSDEERIRNSSNSSGISFRNGGNGRNSKKPKLKKIPQRGLGVAQLEKIRLGEEVKNDTLTLPSPAVATSRPPTAPSLHNPCSLYPWSYSFGSDTLYGHVPCHPHLPVRHHGFGPSPGTQLNNAGVSVGLPSAIFPTEGPASNLLSSGYIGEIEKATLSLNPPSEPNFTSPSIYLSSTVNADAGNSLSAVFNFQTEPPSNQSPFGTYRSVQPDESEKIAGAKRPCPFMLQDPSDPFHGKLNPLTIHGSGRSTSFGNPGSSVIIGNLRHREGLPCSMSMPELHRTNDSRTDCATPDDDFLKLAPPILPSSKSKQAHRDELLEFGSIHSQEVVHAQDSDSALPESNSSIHHHQDQQQQRRPLHSLFPAHNNARRGQPADGSSRYQNGEAEDHLDLNLKL